MDMFQIFRSIERYAYIYYLAYTKMFAFSWLFCATAKTLTRLGGDAWGWSNSSFGSLVILLVCANLIITTWAVHKEFEWKIFSYSLDLKKQESRKFE